MTDQLQVDLDALAKLSPTLESSAKKLTDAAVKSPGRAGEGVSPSVSAAHRLAGHAIPGVQRTVAARLRTVADWSVQAHNGFADTEEHVCQLIRAASPLRTTRDLSGGQ